MPAARPAVGARVGSYVVERVLGEGGMGVVVAARHPTLGDTVAIKLLSPRNTDGVSRERLEREARATFRIRSEHVVRVLGVERLDGTDTPYIVMEMLEGHDLGEILQDRGPLPYGEVADLIIQVCEGVGAAHALGIVHRDLKPSNFFVCRRPDGSALVKVLDFGISKAPVDGSMGEAKLTETRAVFGSPMYMSPEQIRSSKNVDARSDVWSIGVATFELLTGRLPFLADNVAGLLASIVADAPFRPSSFAEVPAAFEETVLACLEKDPARRLGSVAELAMRLAPFASREGALLAERVARGARVSITPSSTPSSAPSRPSAPAPAVALGTTSTTLQGFSPPPPRPRRLVPFVLAGAAAVVLVTAASVLRSGPPGVPPTSAVGGTVAPPAAVMLPVASPSPSPTASPSPSPAAPSATVGPATAHGASSVGSASEGVRRSAPPRAGAAIVARPVPPPKSAAPVAAPPPAPPPPASAAPRGADLDSRY